MNKTIEAKTIKDWLDVWISELKGMDDYTEGYRHALYDVRREIVRLQKLPQKKG